MTNRYEMDMTNGNLFKKIVLFSIPLMLTGILQILYNAADLIIVGQFSSEPDAIGAVGSTSALINLTVTLFMGLSVGANVLVARYFASNDNDKLSKVIHTSITISAIAGIFVGVFGIIFAKELLILMNNPLDLAVKYMKIYFIGMPFSLVYNFAAGILRGVGDTKRPMYYLMISGAINVVLNIFFVLAFNMDVDGVALATIISQLISCVLIMRCLMKTKEAYKFSIKKINVSKVEVLEIIKIGLPAGIQSSIFSISNVLIQSSVNLFGPIAINGNSAAQSVGGFVYTAMNAVYHASLAFTGQNVGAKKENNIKKIAIYSYIFVIMVGFSIGGLATLFGNYILRIYTDIQEEIDVGMLRVFYLCLPYFLCGIMDVTVGILRGLGKSLIPMIVSIIGVVGFRVFWIYAVFYQLTDFKDYNDLSKLYVSYPISWIITFIVLLIMFIIVYKKRMENFKINEQLA